MTEQGPAISLAYERGEAGVMLRPPRNLATERLVSVQSVAYAYGVAGLSATGVCLLNYFMVFLYHGITPKALAFSVNRGHFQPSPFELGADGLTRTLAGRVVPDFVLPDGRVYGAEKQYEIHRESMAAWCAPLPCVVGCASAAGDCGWLKLNFFGGYACCCPPQVSVRHPVPVLERVELPHALNVNLQARPSDEPHHHRGCARCRTHTHAAGVCCQLLRMNDTP